jgi:hypothetical protein
VDVSEGMDVKKGKLASFSELVSKSKKQNGGRRRKTLASG